MTDKLQNPLLNLLKDSPIRNLEELTLREDGILRGSHGKEVRVIKISVPQNFKTGMV